MKNATITIIHPGVVLFVQTKIMSCGLDKGRFNTSLKGSHKFFSVSLFCILVTVFEYKSQATVSHQQAQLRDPTTFNNHSSYHLLSSATATMAKCFTTYTSSNVLALFSLTVCVMLATSAPTLHVRRSTNDISGSGCERIDRSDIFNNRTDLVSSNI